MVVEEGGLREEPPESVCIDLWSQHQLSLEFGQVEKLIKTPFRLV